MKQKVKNSFLYKLYLKTYFRYKKKFFPIKGQGNKIDIQGTVSNISYDIVGNNNGITISKLSYVSNCTFRMIGNNQKIDIKEGVVIYKAEFWIEDDNCEVVIGADTTIQSAHFGVTENNSKVIIGKDCMLSTDVEIRTGDSHSIIDTETGKRINYASNVVLEDHVWVGSKASILKGVNIGFNSIIGAGSVVTKSVPAESIATGIPAKVVRNNINWLRERI